MCVKKNGMKFQNNYHFVTIIGVSRTLNDLHGGVMLLAQDSLGEPFKNISLELLRAMQSTDGLYFIPHLAGIKMPEGSVFDIKPETIATAGGFQLKKSGEFPRCTGGPLSEEELKEKKDQEESLLVLLDPNYVAPWAREYP